MKALILSCSTGGGHNSAALAIKEALIEKNVQADFVEYLSIINDKLKDRVNKIYIDSTKGNGGAFKIAYKLGELYQKTNFISPIYEVSRIHKEKLYKYIIENNYNYIITTHLFPAEALTAIKKEHPIKFIAVATDYVCIPFWEETDPDYLIIPSKELEEDFVIKGIPREKLIPLGIPVAKAYSGKYEKDKCKQELNLNKNEKYTLILTGSMGFGNIMDMLKEMLEKIDNINFIIATGKNKKLLDKINATYKGNSRILAIPFTTKLDLYMKSSEIILTKPGGLTTTEIAVMNKPFIHTNPIPGCENYNANFFEERNMSIKCTTLNEIITSTKNLLENEKLQNKMINNQIKYINKNASKEIAEFIIKEI